MIKKRILQEFFREGSRTENFCFNLGEMGQSKLSRQYARWLSSKPRGSGAKTPYMQCKYRALWEFYRRFGRHPERP